MFNIVFTRKCGYGFHSFYFRGVILLIAIIFSGCSLSLFGNEGSVISTEETPNESLYQNQTLAAGFSNILTATVASTMQPTSDAQPEPGAAMNTLEATAVVHTLTITSQMTPSKTSAPLVPGMVAPTTVHSSSITQVPK